MKQLTLLLSGFLFFAGVRHVSADIIVLDVGYGTGADASHLLFPRFNPLLGNLNAVTIDLSSSFVFSTGPLAISSGNHVLSRTTNYEVLDDFFTVSSTLVWSADFGTHHTFADPVPSLSQRLSLTDVRTQALIGNGYHATSEQVNTCWDLDGGAQTCSLFVSGTITAAHVTYDYTPVERVPEPSSLLLLGSGVASLAGVSWRRRRRR